MRRRGRSSLIGDQAKAESIRFVLAVKGLRSLRDALCAPLTAPERMLMSFLIDRSIGLYEKPQTSHYPMEKCNPCHRFKVLPMFQVAQGMGFNPDFAFAPHETVTQNVFIMIITYIQCHPERKRRVSKTRFFTSFRMTCVIYYSQALLDLKRKIWVKITT